MKCDRCNAEGSDVTVFHGCPVCGPVYLCPRCAELHQREIDEEAAE